MHEMAITQSVVDAVCEHAAGRRVHSVKLEIGELCAVVPDAMQFCFEQPPRAQWPTAPISSSICGQVRPAAAPVAASSNCPT